MIETSREKINISRKIVERKEIIFVEGDMIIPDAKPDILNPISLSGIPTIYRKEAMEGKVRVDGNINTYIMYLSDGEQNETRGINTNLDFSEILEIGQSIEGANINLEANVNSIECKVINERKISLKAAVELKIQMNTSEELEVVGDIKQENNIQVLKETVQVNSLIGIGSTKVHGKETISIDVSDNLAEILKANVTLLDKDEKISYNKVLAKTDAEVKILYLTEENNIKLVVGKVPIVGFVDLQNVTENSICDVNYEIQNLIIKPNNVEEHSVYIELETQITCEAYEEKKINLIKDIYSPYEDIGVDMKQISTIATKKVIREKNQIREKIKIEQMENKKILDVEAIPTIQNENKQNTDLKYECEMELKFILLDTKTSKVEIKQEKIPFEFATNILEEGSNISTNAELQIGAQDYVIQTDTEVNCNIDVTFSIGVEKNVALQIIDNIEENGEREIQKYSVIIYMVKTGDTLWKIAKRFGATVEDIVKINSIEDENKILPGQKIFIPRFYQNTISQSKVPIIENG